MTFKSLLLILLISTFQPVFSQDFDFDISTIPDSLKKNANSIILFDETNIKFESSKMMIISYKKAVFVLNKFGDRNSQIVVHYDSANEIKNIRAYAYNPFGNEVKNIKKKDFIDRSAADGMSLFNDGRIIYYNYVPISYPYTIYYEYEIESSNTAFIPRWYPFDSYNQGLVKSTYKITYPNDLTIKKLEKNFEKFNITKIDKPSNLSYEINYTTAIKYEELVPHYINLMPWVLMSSNKYRLEGTDGVANNWKEFGKWRYEYLYNGNDKINESTRAYAKKLVQDITDPIEKAKKIYEFVQNKTRYISVQEGIGGWKPMKADDVDKLGYGDCKGLSNYTKALLDAVNVESYYSVIWAGDEIRNVEKDIYSMQGNHVILNLPTENGDIWLECTSQTDPFGYQGTFTDDRDVLVITPEGGKIKHTGIYETKQNFKNTISNYKINEEGGLDAQITIKTGGIQYGQHYRLELKPERDIHSHYKKDYWNYINNLTINSYNFKNNKDSIIFKENINVNADDYAIKSGNRMLFVINTFNRSSFIPKRYTNRKLPFEISRGTIEQDEFEIGLPANYTVEALGNNIKVENKFGQYQFNITKINENKLKYKREFILNEGVYPPEDYEDYRNFRKKITKQDKTKIVLIKSIP